MKYLYRAKISQKSWWMPGWNNHTPVNNFRQNVKNLAYFQTVFKTLLNDNFDIFSRNVEKTHAPFLKVLQRLIELMLFGPLSCSSQNRVFHTVDVYR